MPKTHKSNKISFLVYVYVFYTTLQDFVYKIKENTPL